MEGEISHSLIRYIEDNIVSVVNINEIKEFKKSKPQDKSDFKQKAVYVGKYRDDKTPKGVYVPVEIYALGTEEDLLKQMNEKNKRFKFNRFNESDINEKNYDDTCSSAGQSSCESEESESKDIARQKKKKQFVKKVDKTVESEILQKRMNILTETNTLSYNHNDKSKVNADNKLTNKLLDHDLNDVEDKTEQVNENSDLIKYRCIEKKLIQLKNELKSNETKSKACRSLFESSKPSTSKTISPKKISPYPKRRRLVFSSSDDETEKFEPIAQSSPSCFNDNLNKQINDIEEPTDMRENDGNKLTVVNKTHDEVSVDMSELHQPSDGEPMKILQIWEKKSGKEVTKMIYLGENESIQYKAWLHTKKSHSCSLFVKNMARSMYTNGRLLNRCLQVKGHLQKLSDRPSPRKEITPKKIDIIKQCLKYWMKTDKRFSKYSPEDIDEQLCKVRQYLSEEINYIVKTFKQEQRRNLQEMDQEQQQEQQQQQNNQ